ncbi:MAG: phosphatidylinositol glycan, class A [Parcubacteria bacterium C7867-006]|nr:MAG: phosphatidylinositol glycan, class A [Parcubacteria bacterium C7867-006]
MQTHKKTKILYIITKGVWGGAQKYVYSLATELPKEKFEAVVVCGEGEVLKNKLESSGVRVISIQNLKRDISVFDEIKNFSRLYKIIKSEKPDVIHLNSAKASGLGALAGRLLGVKKIIFTAHGWTFNENRNFLSKSIIWVLSWITVVLCHKVIVIATREKRQAMYMPFISKKIKLIRNGVEKINYLEKEEARNALLPELSKNLETNTIWIGTISELTKNKGLKYTLEALSKIDKPFVFIVIGEGEERKNLENVIQEHQLEEKVFLVGSKDAAQYLKAFDIFTLTSLKEGLPYSILEAGLASLPVIATNTGGIPDIIDTQTGILTEKEDVEGIKESIEKLMNDIETRNLYGNNLQNKVEKEFSFDQMLEKTLLLYL